MRASYKSILGIAVSSDLELMLLPVEDKTHTALLFTLVLTVLADLYIFVNTPCRPCNESKIPRSQSNAPCLNDLRSIAEPEHL